MKAQSYPFEIGHFKCIAMRDGGHMGSAEFIFCNAPKDDVAQTLQKHELEADQLGSSWTCLLVDTGKETLLIRYRFWERGAYWGKVDRVIRGRRVSGRQD